MSGDVIFIIVIVVLSVGLPLAIMFWAFRKFGSALASIKNGLPTQATIQSIAETGMTVTTPGVGPEAPVYKIGLQVTPPGGGTPYAAETTHAIPRLFVPMMLPGATIGVLVDPVDPQRVVPDWGRIGSAVGGSAVGGAAGAAGAPDFGQGGIMQVGGVDVGFDAGGQPVQSQVAALAAAVHSGAVPSIKGSAAQLLATGTHGTAVITSAQPLGKTVRDINPKADADKLNDPMWLFTLEISLAGQKPFPAMFGHRVPLAKVASVAPGVKLAVAVDEAHRNEDVAIDWDRSPID
jgi:hypothetical protein